MGMDGMLMGGMESWENFGARSDVWANVEVAFCKVECEV